MISSFRLSDGNGLAAAVVRTEMEKLLECPVCIKIPVPPIYICQTGHSICQDCKPKLKECVVCKKPYSNSRNFALEALIQAAKFYCNHRSKGCTFTGTPDELINHDTICTFRPVKCYLNGENDCNGNVLYMSDYVDHLKTVHKLIPLCHEGNKQNTFEYECYFADWNEEILNSGWVWPAKLINYKNKWLITCGTYSGRLLFVRCMLIGEEAEASKYAVKIVIHNDSISQVPEFSLKTRVESLRTVTENRDKLPPTVIHKDLLVQLGTVTSDETEKKKEMIWIFKYEITAL